MTPTSRYIPNISGNMSYKMCHKIISETTTKCEFLDTISL